MRKSEDLYFKDENGQRHFMATALSAREGFKLVQEGTLLLVKAGALGAMGINGDLNKTAANFSLDALQQANINSDDLLDFENSLLKSITFISSEGNIIPISWDNIDSYCKDQIEVMKLLKAAFSVNFGFLKNALLSISQQSQEEQKEKPAEQVKNSSKRPTFQMR